MNDHQIHFPMVVLVHSVLSFCEELLELGIGTEIFDAETLNSLIK